MKAVRKLASQMGVRHLRQHGLRTTLTAAGVAAGVAMVFSIGTMNAVLVDAMHSTATPFVGRAALQVGASSPGGLSDSLPGVLAHVPGVTAAVPVLEVRSQMSGRRGSRGVFVLGVTPGIAAIAPLNETRARVAVGPSPDGQGVIVSRALADILGVSVGDAVGLEAPGGVVSERVTAIVSSAALDRINGGMVAMMSLPTAQTVFDRASRIDTVLIVAQSHTPIAPLRAAITERVGGAGLVTTPADTPGASNQNVNPFILLTDTLGFIALFVALVLVFNTMSMAMAERRHELSMARAFGAAPRQLFGAVAVEAAILGAAGTVLGLITGGLLAGVLVHVAGHAYRTVLPIDAPTRTVLHSTPLLLAAGAGLAVALLGALVPALRALRAAPIEALRPVASYEWRRPTEGGPGPILAGGGAALLAAGVALLALVRDASPPPALAASAVGAILGGVTLLIPTAVPVAARLAASVLSRGGGTVGRLAGDALRANPKRTAFTAATLILPLAMVVSLGTAFGSAQAKFARLARNLVATPIIVSADSFVGYTASQPLPDTDQAILATVPGVRAVLGSQNTFLTVTGRQSILYAIPLRAAEQAQVPNAVRDPNLSPDPAKFRARLIRGDIAVSRLAARNHHLHPGSALQLPTPAGPHTFTVAAVFDDLAAEDSYYLDRDTYRALWRDNGVFRFAIVPDGPTPIPTLVKRITDAVNAARIPAQIETRAQATRQLETGLAQIFSLARAIQLAALIVATLSLASTAFTTILERRWTLGLQRTLGMSRRQIARSLLLEAAAIGLVGSAGAVVIGLALGVLLVRVFAAGAASPLPITLPWTLVAVCATAGVSISIAATLYPRRLARRAPIIESLRYE